MAKSMKKNVIHIYNNPAKVLTLNSETFALGITDITTNSADYPVTLDSNGNLVCDVIKMLVKYVDSKLVLGKHQATGDKWRLGTSNCKI